MIKEKNTFCEDYSQSSRECIKLTFENKYFK